MVRLYLTHSVSHTLIPATTMSEQHINANRDTTRRDAHQHKRSDASQRQQPRAMEVDNHQGLQVSHSRVTEANALGSRRSPEVSPMATDMIDLASQILPDWEIDANLNLPLHMCRCCDCLLFTKHVKENLQGGAMLLYLECQRKHWRQVLHDEIRDELDEAYKDGLKEGERNIKTLEEKLGYFH